MSEIASAWKKSNNTAKSSYASYILDYTSNLLLNQVDIDLKQLNVNNSTLYISMSTDAYLRENNNFIANKLLPFFKETPSILRDVYLIRQASTKNLDSFFKVWAHLASQSNKEAILKISDLFL